MKRALISVLALTVLFSLQCNKNPAGTSDSSKSIIGRWERYDACSGGGTSSRYCYLFHERTFLFFNGSICADSFADYSRKSGYWSAQSGDLILSTDSLHQQNANQFTYSLSQNNDTLYLTDTKNVSREFHKLPSCYVVSSYCDGMTFRARLGDNFQQAVDSLLKRQDGYQASQLVWDTLAIHVTSDPEGNPYSIPCYSICIRQNSSSLPINSCSDAIDSTGNWFELEICQ
jgi:hypothetical protein